MSRNVSEKAETPRRVLVGVSAGIAAYKTPELVRRLRERGCEVRVAMTRGAKEFITPLTLQAVSGHRVHETLLDVEAEAGMGHIELARWADDIVVAPATADLLARLAAGMADDLLTTAVLASRARLWLAPAMNHVMWDHPAVRQNIATLEQRGARTLGPGSGSQACGEEGYGRMLAPGEIADAVTAGSEALAGKRFVVTAGPTYEALDPVRFIGNRSSGRMGFAVAEALAEAGAEVTLIAGPVHLSARGGIERIDVRTAAEMRDAVMAQLPADAFVSVAAVADYRPASRSDEKIKRSGESMQLELVPNPDILREVAGLSPRPFVVGFAAETSDVGENARAKLEAKSLDLIAANRVGDDCGFDAGENALVVYSSDREWDLGSASKTALAEKLVSVIAEQMENA
ncbi:MAG: bifunctional phosphopantothenoylcysteine decarboxylase/phosphopantothenate--cysteine ligase CoaBC [Wenzhouxiangellaceae bacterium]|jgi:phosphopantothenoylcysteine decarboxylase/phosphopantothenate--cysteine ligase|nr:bifunctional phosphopantothenoylcysteine decarboxylase/phosphopantothenate--cysteine ligase CoaBC [Wenzhouxiangellaceae bacterium]MBS3747117.1 bifunctional phosphopantothenoylcysteine decarboxylase/phosphopantothenate--cysteine ligase CoaBC [Wenzhouxiangellaceae bacterium]MBS3822497.1 bifunctional phosphopantothenoylcysteine decarboxylase/phosphopantothenate--cysteine ligase CoaBC [Wenzhouxiangellaceae bacterium]